jgi:acyl carrier protein
MNDQVDDVVRRAIAKHLGVDRRAIDPFQELQRDLHLQPLDIVLIVLAIEDAERIEMPIAHIDSVATVGGLTTLTRRIRASARHAYERVLAPNHRRHRRARRAQEA